MKKFMATLMIIAMCITLPQVETYAFSLDSIIDFIFGTSTIKGREDAGRELKKQLLNHETRLDVLYNVEDVNMFLLKKEFYDVYDYRMEKSDEPGEGDFLYNPGTLKSSDDYITYYKQDDGSYNIKIDIEIEYFLTKEEEKAFVEKAKEVIDSLHMENDSEYEKVRKIYNYICSNVTYDYARLEDDSYGKKYTAYAALIDKTAVCSGVANLFYYMAKSAGLDVRCKTNANHIWNFVKVDGLYYYLDATWDLGKAEKDYKYFLKGYADFEEHRGNTEISIFGNGLTYTDLDYDFAMYGYNK